MPAEPPVLESKNARVLPLTVMVSLDVKLVVSELVPTAPFSAVVPEICAAVAGADVRVIVPAARPILVRPVPLVTMSAPVPVVRVNAPPTSVEEPPLAVSIADFRLVIVALARSR